MAFLFLVILIATLFCLKGWVKSALLLGYAAILGTLALLLYHADTVLQIQL